MMIIIIFLSFFLFLENNWVRLWIRKIPSLWEGKGAAPPAGNCQFAAIFSLSHLIQYILIDHWWYQANCQLIWCQLISVWVDFYWLIFGGCCDLGAGFPPFSRDRSRISIHIVAGKMIELSNESELIWIIHSLGFRILIWLFGGGDSGQIRRWVRSHRWRHDATGSNSGTFSPCCNLKISNRWRDQCQ